MNKFSERYKLISNSDLLKIIGNSFNYQPEAVKAARNEIEQRQLTEQQLKEAKEEIEAELLEKSKRTEKRQEVENRVKKIGVSLLDSINPIQRSTPSTEKLIRLITIVFGLVSIYQLFDRFSMLQFMFSDDGGDWDLSTVLFIVPLLILPTSIILFWLKKKIGWILLSAYLIYSILNVIVLSIMIWKIEPSGIPALDSLFPQISQVTLIFTFLFFGGTLWVICKENLRGKFTINKQTMLGTIGITILLTLLTIAPYF